MMQKTTRLRAYLRTIGAVAITMFVVPLAQARGAIESISGFMQGGAEVLQIEFSEPQTEVPTGFSIQSPARIALDFPGVSNGTGRSSININQGNIKSANIVQAGDRARIVLNLKQPTSYRAELQGKAVVVLLDTANLPAKASAAQVTSFAESQNIDTLPLKDLDFRRGADGAGRIVVGLPLKKHQITD